jgi:hypothetical protein
LGPAPSFDLEFATDGFCQIERAYWVYELQDWVIVGELCTAANPMKVDSPAHMRSDFRCPLGRKSRILLTQIKPSDA